MGRTIQTQKGKAKWYDLPLTEQEIERGNTIGKFGRTDRHQEKSIVEHVPVSRGMYAHPTSVRSFTYTRPGLFVACLPLGVSFAHTLGYLTAVVRTSSSRPCSAAACRRHPTPVCFYCVQDPSW